MRRRLVGVGSMLVLGACLSVPDADEPCSGDDCGSTGTTSTSGTTTVTTASTTVADPTTGTSTSAPTGTGASESSTTSATTGSTDTGSSTGGSPLDDDPALVAWYEFETDPEQGVLDSGPNALHGICAGTTCPALDVGRVGQALHFDGADDFVRIDMPATHDHPDAWTVAVWIQRDTVDESVLRMPLGRAWGTGSLNTYEIYFHDWEGAEPVYLYVASTTLSNLDRIPAPNELPTGEWIHVAGTWDGTLLRLWIDGLPVASTPIELVAFDDHDLILGGDENSSNPVTNFFDGSLDDLRIYARALTSTEIAELAAL